MLSPATESRVPRLPRGGRVRVVSPSRSLAIVPPDVRQLARERLQRHGFEVELADVPFTCDRFAESRPEERVRELVEAWAEPSVDALLTAVGGWSSNSLLGRLNWSELGRSEKVLCSHSDGSALLLAMHARCGLVTYFGPHFSNLGMREGAEFTWDRLLEVVVGEPREIACPASPSWSDDAWYRSQGEREFHPNPGPLAVREGSAQGRLLGGNLSTLRLLQGTPYLPPLQGSILFVEEVARSAAAVPEFSRQLQALMHHPEFPQVRGLLIGRFGRAAQLPRERLRELLRSFPEIRGIPVAADLDFGHTTPQLTLPIGGSARIAVSGGRVDLTIAADGRWHA
jgi:muramoyltetrapeptide carboxypeptidase